MIMAIAVIVTLATIMALSLSLSTQLNKRSTDIYAYEQAALLNKSATEYVLLQIAKNGCQNGWNFSQGIYDVNITAEYIYSAASGCNDYFIISTPESSGNVILNVSVSVNDPSLLSEPIRYFRRTIQKL